MDPSLHKALEQRPARCVLPYVQSPSKTQETGVCNRRGPQNWVCVVALSRAGANPACALAGPVTGGHILGSVPRWDHSGKIHCRHLRARVPDNERKRRWGSLWNLSQALDDQSHWPLNHVQKSAYFLKPNRFLGLCVYTSRKLMCRVWVITSKY